MKKSSLLFMVASIISLSFLAGCNNDNSTSSSSYSVPTYDEDSISIHYNRNDAKYSAWELWIWETNAAGAAYSFNGFDSYGAVAAYPLSTWNGPVNNTLGFIVRSVGGWTKKDISEDRFIDFSKFNKDENGIYHVYLKSGDANIYTNPEGEIAPAIESAYFSTSKQIIVETNALFKSISFYKNESLMETKEFSSGSKGIRYYLPNNETADYTSSYNVKVTFLDTEKIVESPVTMRNLFSSSEFDNLYTYNGDDLGVTYTKSDSLFKVWSPLSSSIKLRIYDNGTPKSVSAMGSDAYSEYLMTKGDKGVFSAKVTGDLAGKYYTFVVTNASYKEREIVDPYAKSSGVNGKRGMIVDFLETNPIGWNDVSIHEYDRKSLTVYETHISDLTSSSTWNGIDKAKYRFAGAYEEGTTYSENGITVKTGFDHIKELGVNAVQLLPIFDQDNDELSQTFNWGYNPLNYNCLEGLYSSNPLDGYTRIKEFKQLVMAYNKAGINIIMDVVYNHVSGALGSNFDVLMPGYYFRYNSKGTLSNGSGCGNETASDLPMFRKFMIDSTKFWASEYKLGGFRFDLMGLHDLETMNQLVASLNNVNKYITVYGEPWTGGDTTLSSSKKADQKNGNSFVGYGQFNDQMRDALIKGGLNSSSALGWISNTNNILSSDTTAIDNGVRGKTVSSSVAINDPDKTVNYVTCHDNYTLYDRFKAAGIRESETIKKMAMLANSIVFTSQGTTFMLAGEEFLRTKLGNSNSYDASYTVNELDYSLKIKNIDMFKNYQKLISLKLNTDGLHLDKDGIQTLSYSFNEAKNEYVMIVSDTKNNLEYKIIHANGALLNEHSSFDLSGYSLYLDTIDSAKILNNATIIQPFETLIAYKKTL